MKEELQEVVSDIGDILNSFFSNNRIDIISSIYKIAKDAKGIQDKITLTKIAKFITYGGQLANNVEAAFDRRVLFGDNKDSRDFFMNLLTKLNQLDEEEKIKYFSMLCNARVKSNIDIDIYEKIYKTIHSCTASELGFIKDNIGYEISEKENTITIFSLIQYGLIQKLYNEKEKSNRYYFTEYAGIVYKYALNYNNLIDDVQLSLRDITIKEDDYTLNKVVRLDNINNQKEPISISDIQTKMDFKNNSFNLQFVISNNGINIKADKLYFAFKSSGGYYVCRRYNCNGYFYSGNLKGDLYEIGYEFEKLNTKTCDEYGIVFYFKVTNQDTRYFKIFHYYKGYTKQEISEEIYNKETNQFDESFKRIETNNYTNDYYIRLASIIMNYEYTKEG